jgi:glucan phosphoethanolaminetransferase (alkaline phosphatase superfamily)
MLFGWSVVALIVPNVVLDITEGYPLVWCVANVLLPLGFYLLYMSMSRKVGVMTLATLPLMFFAAFQMVLIHLYGESIIAVDMFLNVVTTNVSEATELLSNLLVALADVTVLYAVSLAWGVIATLKHWEITERMHLKTVKCGAMAMVIGAVFALAGVLLQTGSVRQNIFPINVLDNLIEAVSRASEASHYGETSAAFSYQSQATHPAEEREVYVFVVGETSRAINWQLGGYNRDTNPKLSTEANFVFCPKAISESNTTHKSVPMLLSCLSAEDFKSLNKIKSIITAMNEAGFYTRFFSNQAPNRSYTQFFGDEADEVTYNAFDDYNIRPYDSDLLPQMKSAITDMQHNKQFIVFHTYGSHFRYRDRYPAAFSHFTPDDNVDASVQNRDVLMNAYNNSIVYTDNLLWQIIECLKNEHCRSALLYSSDHGEDIFDDKRERFLHASPNPTYYQLHVAMGVWLSDATMAADTIMAQNLLRNAQQCVSPQKSMFNTAMEIAGVESPYVDKSRSLVSESYNYDRPVYLTDRNVAVPLSKSGLKKQDISHLKALSKMLTD